MAHARCLSACSLALTLLALAGCGKAKSDVPPTAASAALSAAPPAAPAASAPLKAGRITWTDPSGWTRSPPTNVVRVAQYAVPPVAGDSEAGECVVTTFGPGQGGTAENNVDRWIRQFEPDDKAQVERDERQVAGMRVTTVALSGTYKGMTMPGQKPQAAKARYRLIGAIVEAPSGLWFFKLTGPEATVKGAGPAFRSLVDSVRL